MAIPGVSDAVALTKTVGDFGSHREFSTSRRRTAQQTIICLVTVCLVVACSRGDRQAGEVAAIRSTLASARAALETCDANRLFSLTSPTDDFDPKSDEGAQTIKEFNEGCRSKDSKVRDLLKKIVLAEGMMPKLGVDGVSAQFDMSSLGTWHNGYEIRLVKYDGRWYLRGKD